MRMERNETEFYRQRAEELRAIAYFIDNRRKHETLLWLARDYETLAEDDETAGLGTLLRQLHILAIAERLRPLQNLACL